MRQIFYVGGSFFVGDDICKAVMRLSRALATAGRTDIISIPVYTTAGVSSSANLLVGPASQIFSIYVEVGFTIPEHPDVVQHLERETARLDPTTRAWPLEPFDEWETPYDGYEDHSI